MHLHTATIPTPVLAAVRVDGVPWISWFRQVDKGRVGDWFVTAQSSAQQGRETEKRRSQHFTYKREEVGYLDSELRSCVKVEGAVGSVRLCCLMSSDVG